MDSQGTNNDKVKNKIMKLNQLHSLWKKTVISKREMEESSKHRFVYSLSLGS
jgi:uncharacterized protein YnzC (UPF0291/DUF896 family)